MRREHRRGGHAIHDGAPETEVLVPFDATDARGSIWQMEREAIALGSRPISGLPRRGSM